MNAWCFYYCSDRFIVSKVSVAITFLGLVMETHSTMEKKETEISKMEELEQRLIQRFSTKLKKMEKFFSEMNQLVAEMKESVHGLTPNSIASSHGRSSLRTYPLPFRPQTVHQCLVLGRLYERAYPIACCEEEDAHAGSLDGDEFVLDTSSALLTPNGEDTLPLVIGFEIEAIETNLKEVQVTDLIQEEESLPEKKRTPKIFHQIAAFKNKVSISLLESSYNDDQEVKELAAESVQKIEHSVFENSVDAPRTYNLIDRAEFSQQRVGVLHLNNMAVSVETSLSFRTLLCAFKLLQESRENRQGLLSKMPKSWHFKYKLQEHRYMKTQLPSPDVSSLATALNMSTAESIAQIQLEELKHRLLQRRTQSLVPNSQSQFHSSLVLHVISSGVSSEVWVTHQNRIPYVLPVEKVKVTTLKSTTSIDKETAPQKFDKQVHQTEYLTTKEKQMTCFKSWRFKFKQKLQVEDCGAVLSHLFPLKEIAGQDWDETLFEEDKLEHRRLKKLPKTWWFKFKQRSWGNKEYTTCLRFVRRRTEQGRSKQNKLIKDWKFKFKGKSAEKYVSL